MWTCGMKFGRDLYPAAATNQAEIVCESSIVSLYPAFFQSFSSFKTHLHQFDSHLRFFIDL